MLFQDKDRIVFAGDSVTDMEAHSLLERGFLTILVEAMCALWRICLRRIIRKEELELPTQAYRAIPAVLYWCGIKGTLWT